MVRKYILCISAHQASAYRWQGGALRFDARFDASEAGHAAFADYLGTIPDSVFQLLVNVAEESFQQDLVPYLQRADRNAVIERKLNQLFHGTPYSAAQSLGYEKSRRKNEQLLFSALTNPATIDPWVNALRAERVAIAGIHSLSGLGQPLLRALKIEADRCILLSMQDQSIRESYFENGTLRLSRLSTLSNTSIAGLAQGFAAEAGKLQQYLLSQRIVTRNQHLHAVVVAHPAALSAIESRCVSNSGLSFQIVSTESCAASLKCGRRPDDSNIEALFAHLLATRPPRQQLARAELRHDFRIHQMRLGLRAAAALVLAGGVLFAATQYLRAYTIGQETAQLESDAGLARNRYEDIVRTFPPIPVGNDILRSVAARHGDIVRGGVSPEPFLREFSGPLAAFPQIELESIEWRSGGSENAQVATIKGTIHLGNRVTPRQTLGVFQQFVNALRQMFEVRVVEQPFDIDSGKSLTSGSEDQVEHGARPFVLQVIRKEAAS